MEIRGLGLVDVRAMFGIRAIRFQKRVEVARALTLGPKLLLLDEPMAGLGPGGTVELSRLIGELKGELSILLIEHDMDVVFSLAYFNAGAFAAADVDGDSNLDVVLGANAIYLGPDLPAAEVVQWHRYMMLNDAPVLVLTVNSADKMGIFERQRLRVFDLRADRTRAGAGPLLEGRTASRTRSSPGSMSARPLPGWR